MDSKLATLSCSRAKNEVVGLTACIRAGRITTMCDQRMKVKINSNSIQETAEKLIAQRQQNKHTKWDDDGNAQETGRDCQFFNIFHCGYILFVLIF